jgi:hypothetical protein
MKRRIRHLQIHHQTTTQSFSRRHRVSRHSTICGVFLNSMLDIYSTRGERVTQALVIHVALRHSIPLLPSTYSVNYPIRKRILGRAMPSSAKSFEMMHVGPWDLGAVPYTMSDSIQVRDIPRQYFEHLRDHRFGHVRDLNGTFRCTSKRYLNGPLRRRWVVVSIFTFT